jgi:hypothetical protein
VIVRQDRGALRLGRLRARRGDRVESEAVIDGTSLSGAMLQDRFALSSARQGARRSQGAEIRELAGRAGLNGVRLARDCSSPAYGMTAAVRRLHVSGHELKGDGGLAYG